MTRAAPGLDEDVPAEEYEGAAGGRAWCVCRVFWNGAERYAVWRSTNRHSPWCYANGPTPVAAIRAALAREADEASVKTP